MDVHHLYVKLNQVVVRSITLSSGHHNRPPKNKYIMQGDISTKLCVLPMVSMSKQNKTKTLAYMSKCACGKPNSRRQCRLPSLHGDHLTINVHSLVFERWMNSSPPPCLLTGIRDVMPHDTTLVLQSRVVSRCCVRMKFRIRVSEHGGTNNTLLYRCVFEFPCRNFE